MIILLLVVSIVLIIVGFVLAEVYDVECIGVPMSGIGIIIGFISFIVVIVAAVRVSSSAVVDEKIAMYEEENQRIEASITAVVENYQQYETDIFKDVSESHSESSMILVTMYPELKSDALVQEQITIYTANNEKIKQLKEERINASVWRWWLYFGK